jgi:hypothetical protein
MPELRPYRVHSNPDDPGQGEDEDPDSSEEGVEPWEGEPGEEEEPEPPLAAQASRGKTKNRQPIKAKKKAAKKVIKMKMPKAAEKDPRKSPIYDRTKKSKKSGKPKR